MPPEISIIIPTYNVQDFIGETLQSVVDQTLSKDKFEVIMVDDASSDKTIEIAQAFAKKYKNIHMFYHDKNQGISKTRNDAIDKSSGKLIALLDGDDILESVALESTTYFMRNNLRVRYSYSGYNKIDSKGIKIGQVASLPFDKKRFFHQNFVGPITCFERTIHDKIGGFENRSRIEDWNHALKASKILIAGQIANNPKFLYKYRIHQNNISKVGYRSMKEAACNTIARFLEHEGINANVYWSKMITHLDGSKHNYYDWKEIPAIISKAIPVAIPA